MKHTVTLLIAVLISMVLGGLLSPSIAASPWSGTAQAPSISGSTYSITTAEELAWIAQQSQTDDFAGKTVRLEADIDLGGTQELPPSWEPIGCAQKPFRGELDGGNHVLYNLYILNSFASGAGLIAETGAEAHVHHIGLAQGQIMTDATNDVGSIAGVNRGRISHCFNMAQIIAHNGDNVGGLVGVNYGVIEYSYNTGIITDANNHVGGLVGVNKSSAVLKECYNSGYCKGQEHTGALFGLNEANAGSLTRVYFDQQVTRTYATGYGTGDALDNTKYAVEKTSAFLSAGSPFAGLAEWSVTRDGAYRYPRLKCFGEHEASLLSTDAILLDAENLPVERAEGVGAPMTGNRPRKQFKLIGNNTAEWRSSGEDVIRIVNSSTATVVRPCGNQEVILTVSEGNASKQIYTIVKGYEKFDAGKMEGSVTACWREEEVKILNANKSGKEPIGGKDDEQDGECSYRYMLIRDTVVCDEDGKPLAYNAMDTLFFGHNDYRNWSMPTSVSGTYAFRRYAHDYQCTTEWTESPGRLYLTVLQPFEAGRLYETTDTVYGVPSVLTIHSEQNASGGGGVFKYLWKAVTPSGTKNPVYVDDVIADGDTLNYPFTEPGEYVFTRRATDATCNTTPVASEGQHKVVVFAAVEPGAIDSFDIVLCKPRYSGVLQEADTASGGNGRYVYRWLCNDEPIFHSDTCSLPLTSFPMADGGTYVFQRQVKDDSRFSEWVTSAGEVRITIDGTSEDCQVICPVVEIQAVADICQADSALMIRFEVVEGEPDSYDLLFPADATQAGFVSEVGAALPEDSIIVIALPDGAPMGTYYISLTFYSSEGVCKGATHFFPFTLLTDGFVHQKWNDVLFVDNNPTNGTPAADMRFTTYQWYKDGVAVNGATEQSYYEPGGLNGAYQVLMTGTDGVLYRSCVYDIFPDGVVGVTATDSSEFYYTVDGRQCAAPRAPGIYISKNHKLIVR